MGQSAGARFQRVWEWGLRHQTAIWIVVIGLLIRYALAIYSAEEDTVTFAAAAQSMAYGQAPYTYLVLYPPGWVYLLGLLGRSYSLFFGSLSILTVPNGLQTLNTIPNAWYESPYYPSIGFDLYLKSFIFVFDVLSGLLIYCLIRDRVKNPKIALTGLALWILNPLVITVSALHGTYDSIPAFLMLLAYYFSTRCDFLYSGISLSLGAILKVFPAVLVPVFFVLIWDLAPRQRAAFAKGVLWFMIGFSAVLCLVFWPPGIISQWLSLFFTGTGRGGEPFGGFNQWSVLTIHGARGLSAFLTANADTIIIVTALEVLLGFGYVAWRTATTLSKSTEDRLGYWDGTFLFAVCLTYIVVPLVQPQYLIWVMPWLILVTLVHSARSALAWGSFTTVTVGVVLFYFFGLTSPLFFFQPFVLRSHWIGFGVYESSLVQWSKISPNLDPFFQIPVAVALAGAGAMGMLISRRYRSPLES
ncbi:MAG: glycosyltransferase family 87 protein [Thermoplasmata archaeon]